MVFHFITYLIHPQLMKTKLTVDPNSIIGNYYHHRHLMSAFLCLPRVSQIYSSRFSMVRCLSCHQPFPVFKQSNSSSLLDQFSIEVWKPATHSVMTIIRCQDKSIPPTHVYAMGSFQFLHKIHSQGFGRKTFVQSAVQWDWTWNHVFGRESSSRNFFKTSNIGWRKGWKVFSNCRFSPRAYHEGNI